MKSYHRQQGATLLVSLIMLVILTLFAVSAINLSSINLKIAGNSQVQQSMEANAQQAIEQMISTVTNFTAPPTTPTLVNVNTGTVNAATVTVNPPTCLATTTATGYSYLFALAPQDTHWELQSTVTDAASGASTEMHQGVKVRLPANSCP